MDNLIFINAIAPYLYLTLIWCSGEIQLDITVVLVIFMVGILLQILLSSVIAISSKTISRLTKNVLIVKLLQIPYYVIYCFLAFSLFALLMSFRGAGLLVLPFLILIDIFVFLTTVIPMEICIIRLKIENKVTIGEMILHLVLNAIYIVDVISAICIVKKVEK